MLWSELEAGLDGLMLAMGGGWLRNIADAVRAYERLELFTAAGLETARRGRTPCFANRSPYKQNTESSHFAALQRVTYQRHGAGCKRAEGSPIHAGWLEQRLGPLAYYQEEEEAA